MKEKWWSCFTSSFPSITNKKWNTFNSKRNWKNLFQKKEEKEEEEQYDWSHMGQMQATDDIISTYSVPDGVNVSSNESFQKHGAIY